MLPLSISLIITLGFAVLGYVIAPRRAIAFAGGDSRTLAALPKQYGLYTCLAILIPSIFILIVGSLAGGGAYFGWIIVTTAAFAFLVSFIMSYFIEMLIDYALFLKIS